MFTINRENKNYIETEAVVTNTKIYEEEYTDANGDTTPATYTVDITYKVNDDEYNNRLEGVSKYNVGDKLKIFYNPSDPNQITQTKSLVLPITLICGGVVALVGGVISAINAVKRHKEMKSQEKEWKKNGK